MRLFGAAASLGAALVLAANAPAAESPIQILSATVNADRTISVSWNVPVGMWGGVLIINPTPTTDSTGELPFGQGTTIGYDQLGTGRTHHTTLPLKLSIQQPLTIYAQVQLIDPYGTGGCQQGQYLADCDSQVVALPIDPFAERSS